MGWWADNPLRGRSLAGLGSVRAQRGGEGSGAVSGAYPDGTSSWLMGETDDHLCDDCELPIDICACDETNPCLCVDCGGTEPAHSSDCTYMRDTFG
jgi:hypothetical protein